jgi:acyl carrier protein
VLKVLERYAGKLDVGLPPRSDTYSFSGFDDSPDWSAIMKLTEAEVRELFAAMIAAQTGTFNDRGVDFGDDPEVVALAETLGLKGAERECPTLHLRPVDLENLRRPGLATIAAELGMQPTPSLKLKELQTRIKAAAGIDGGAQTDLAIVSDYVAPQCRFGAADAIRQALAVPATEREAAGGPHPNSPAGKAASTEEAFRSIVKGSLRIDDFTWSDRIEDVCDDVAHTALIGALSAGFAIEVPDSAIERCPTFRALLEEIERLRAGGDGADADPEAGDAAQVFVIVLSDATGKSPGKAFPKDQTVFDFAGGPEDVEALLDAVEAAYAVDLDADAERLSAGTLQALYDHVQANRPDRALFDAPAPQDTDQDADQAAE